MSIIVAKNTDGVQRTFTAIQWNLLGRNKGQWMQVESQKVESNLNTGEKKQKSVVIPEIQIELFLNPQQVFQKQI
jgi:hypothetical protein